MPPEAAESEWVKLSIALTPEQRDRLAKVAAARETVPAATLRWLLNKSLDWWDGLSREQREGL